MIAAPCAEDDDDLDDDVMVLGATPQFGSPGMVGRVAAAHHQARALRQHGAMGPPSASLHQGEQRRQHRQQALKAAMHRPAVSPRSLCASQHKSGVLIRTSPALCRLAAARGVQAAAR